MTTPASAAPQQYPPAQQPPPPSSLKAAAEAELVTTTAGLLITATGAAAAAAILVAKFRIQGDLRAGLYGSLGIAMAHPPPVTGVIGPASAQTGRMNLARRAQFVVSAAKRLAADVAAWRAGRIPPPTPEPEPPGPAAGQAADLNLLRRGQFAEAKRRRLQADIDAAEDAGRMQALQDGLARERRYYSLHLAAMWNRAVAAGKTDMAAMEHGNLLSWNTILDHRTSPECKAADGKSYRASRMPKIGFPGAVHPFCRCFPGAPHPGAPMLPV